MTIFDVMVDVDDVIFPTIDSIHSLAMEAGLHDGSVDPKWTGWEAYTLPDGSPCPPEVYWDLWSQFALTGGYLNTPPVPEAAEALRRLHWAGHRIHLVTARGFMNHAEDIRAWTPQWLEEFAIPHKTLTFAQDKVAAMAEILTPNKIFAEIYKNLVRFDYAIDDRVPTIRALRDTGVKAYVLTHPHNRDEEAPWRVTTVAEFVDIILEAA